MTGIDEKADIRSLLEDWAKASCAGDLDAIMAVYAPDVLAFDAVGELRFEGAQAYRKHWQACLAMCPGPMTFELHDLDVTVGGDIAFGHYLARCGATLPDGKERGSWFRGTTCFRRTGGTWRIVHEHLSAPFEPESGKTLLDLEPRNAEVRFSAPRGE